MSKFTDHLQGLAELEGNTGKKVAFHSAAIEIESLQQELDDLKASVPKVKAGVVREAANKIDWVKVVGNYLCADIYEALKEYANKLEQGDTE